MTRTLAVPLAGLVLLILGSCAGAAGARVSRQPGLPDGSQRFLEEAKPGLSSQFLQFPDLTGLLEGYEWHCVFQEDRLDENEQQEEVIVTTQMTAAWDGTLMRYSQDPQLENRYRFVALDGRRAIWDSDRYADPQVYAEAKELLWSDTDFELIGREDLAGRQALVFRFRTKGNLRGHLGHWWISKTEGKAWFDEEDKFLVRIEGCSYDDVRAFSSFANEGNHWSWQLRRTAEGEWVPDYHEYFWMIKKGIPFFYRVSHWRRESFRWSDVRRVGRTPTPK